MITILVEGAILAMEKLVKELEDAAPAKREQFVKLAIRLLEIASGTIKQKL